MTVTNRAPCSPREVAGPPAGTSLAGAGST